MTNSNTPARKLVKGFSRLLLATGLLATSLLAQNITSIQNPASNILTGLPNYGIAEGSIFIVYGSGLGPAAISVASTLPFGTSLSGTSVKITAGGQTYSAFLFYTLSSQVAAVMPSNVPAGSATVQVTYNGTPSPAFSTTVVVSNFGISTVNQTGAGPAVVTFPTSTAPGYGLITNSVSAVPLTTYTIYGTGLGPNAASDNNVAAGALSTAITVWVGGIKANIAYQGRGSGVALDQINFQIPAGLSGCNVSLVVQTGNLISNTTTIPIAPNGGACSDATSVSNAATNTALATNGAVRIGGVSLSQSVLNISVAGQSFNQTTNSANGSFESYTASQYGYLNPTSTASNGNCTVIISTSTSATAVVPTGLDAGKITVTPPSGATLTLSESPTGSYSGTPSALTAGTYTVTGSGGANVGAFTASLTVPTPLTWTNQAAISAGTIVRSQGQTVTWTGGASNGYTIIEGFSGVGSGSSAVTTIFFCTAPTAAGQFTIPAFVLLALPASTVSSGVPSGIMFVGSSPNPVSFSASGLDVGYLSATSSSEATVNYQ